MAVWRRGMAFGAAWCIAVQGLAGGSAGWRGDGSGLYADARPPSEWAPDTNILWSAALPGWGNGTPVIVGDRIVVGSEPTTVLCLDAADGRLLWAATNTYFDALSPAEIEQAKEMQRQASELNKEAGALDQERNKLQQQLNELDGLRKKIADLETKLDLISTPEVCAVEVADREAKASETAAQLEKDPNNGGLKQKAQQLAEELKLLKNEDLVNERLEAARADLAQREPQEAGLKERVEALRKQADGIRRERLPPLQRYNRPPTHGANGYSTATAVSDGSAIFVLRGNGMAACYEPDGKRRWIRFVHKPTHGWGHSASPVLAGGILVVHLQHLVGLDPATGQTRWEVPQAAAPFGTPVVADVGGEPIVITANGDFVRASDGKLLAARLAKLDYAAPVLAQDVVYFIQHGGKAIKLPDAIGEEFKPEVLWTASAIAGGRYFASALVLDGLIYAVNEQSQFSCIDAGTGALVYSRKLDLGATVYPSIACAGGLLYVSAENGTTAVIKPGREFSEAARNKLEAFRACPVFAGQRLYIRGMKHLYCIGAATP